MRHRGQCHCGEIRFTFESSKPLAPRACQCGFCRRHGARTLSDPDGAALLALGPATRRYRFGTGGTDFLLCGRCGFYAGATIAIGGRLYATLNLNGLDDETARGLVARPVSYDGESPAARSERRRLSWTPAIIQPDV
jgi:hypothetical protein